MVHRHGDKMIAFLFPSHRRCILLVTRDAEQHIQPLGQFFHRLAEYGLIINRTKCEFGVHELDFIGHRVDKQGIRCLSLKVQAMQAFSQPASIHKLRELLSLVNFYNRFMPNCAAFLRLLMDMLQGSESNAAILTWIPDALTASHTIKKKLSEATLLAHPRPGAPLCPMTDASDAAVVAVLQHFADIAWQPLAFFSDVLVHGDTLQYTRQGTP